MLNYREVSVFANGRTEMGSKIMRMLPISAGIVLLCAVTSPVFAADMAVKASPAPKVAAAEPVCLRWVQQNYSWYNYCDPVPYYPRSTRYWWGL